MAIWSSALGYPIVWRGPTPNRVAGGMYEWRGVVLHIAEGSYDGTISWQLNHAAEVSSHFIVAKDGRIAQMVDTLDRAWTQADGNGRWLSIEHEGFHGEPLTDAQIEADAHLYAEAALVYGVPLQTTDDPAGGFGLGYHAMGGAAWGGHYDCPGDPIIAQRQRILDRCAELLHPTPPEEDDMPAFQTGQLKPGFFEDVLSDDGTTVLAPKRSFVTELAVPPCNGGALPWGDGYLSFAADFTGAGRVRARRHRLARDPAGLRRQLRPQGLQAAQRRREGVHHAQAPVADGHLRYRAGRVAAGVRAAVGARPTDWMARKGRKGRARA
jgi:hypothetical protein